MSNWYHLEITISIQSIYQYTLEIVDSMSKLYSDEVEDKKKDLFRRNIPFL